MMEPMMRPGGHLNFTKNIDQASRILYWLPELVGIRTSFPLPMSISNPCCCRPPLPLPLSPSATVHHQMTCPWREWWLPCRVPIRWRHLSCESLLNGRAWLSSVWCEENRKIVAIYRNLNQCLGISSTRLSVQGCSFIKKLRGLRQGWEG